MLKKRVDALLIAFQYLSKHADKQTDGQIDPIL